MSEILDFINSGIRVFDGATGSLLFQFGFNGEGCPEKVDKELIKQVHKTYIDAGSDFVSTNTFGANSVKLSKYGLGEHVREINIENVQIAKNACPGAKYYVAGDIGPTGELIEPYGSFTEELFVEVFAEQAEALEEGGADIIIIETMSAVEEIVSAIKAIKRYTKLPVIASMTFNETPNGFRTMMGVDVKTAVESCEKAGADVVGSNCSLVPEQIVRLVKEIKKYSTKPILVQPNAGAPKLVSGKTVYDPIENLEETIKAIVEAGAGLIGGCCGTDGNYIKTVAKVCRK